MSDQENYEYVDEDGNPLTPEEVAALGDDVEVEEVVEEVAEAPAPAAKQPAAAPAPSAPVGKGVKAALAGAAVVVLALGGGLAYTMSQAGNEHTAADVKAGVASKSAAASAAVESKKQEVKEDVSESRTGQRVLGMHCPNDEVLQAQWSGGDDAAQPAYQLRKLSATSLPGGFTERVSKKEQGEPRELVMLQLDEYRMGLYVSSGSVDSQTGKSTWWKVTVSTSGAEPAILGEGQGDGTDKDVAKACDTLPESEYLVVDAGSDDAPTSLSLLKPARGGDGFVYAVSGDQLLKLGLEKADAPKGGDAASSSAEAEPEN